MLQRFFCKAVLPATMVLLLFAPTHARAESGRIHLTLLRTKNAEDNRGVLFYDAQRYRLAIKGIEPATGDTKRVDLVGRALNLHNVDDIIGNYHAAAAGTTTISGSNEARLQNDAGTTLELRAAKPLASPLELRGLVLEARGWHGKAKSNSRDK